MEIDQQEEPKFLVLFNFDVSESMAKPFDETANSTTCSESIFSALDKLVQKTNKHKIIKVGGALFGCKLKQECDFMKLMSSIEINENLNQNAVSQEIIEYCDLNSESYRERLGKLGEKFGAKYLYQYLQKTSEKQCEEIYKIAIGDSNLCTLLVDNLPPKVKNGAETAIIHGGKGIAKASPFLFFLGGVISIATIPIGGAGFIAAPILFSLGIPSYFGAKAIDESYDSSVQEEVDHALQICTDNICKRISCDKYDWSESLRLTLLSGENLKTELEEFKKKVNQIGIYPLMNYFKQFVYGRAATSVALTNSFATFLDNKKTRYRILFLITDGEHTEGIDPYEYLVESFENDDLKDIIFVSCYFSSKLIKNPRKLYYSPPPGLDSYCNKLFKMSSVLPVCSSGFQILSQKYHWEMPKERACHLFFQVNHPDIINEFSEVLTDLINDENYFTNAISSIYINAIRDDQLMNQQSFDQKNEPICFAYACSCTIQLSLCRIFCRNIPSFNSIFNQIINDFSPKRDKGAVTSKVLEKYCKKYKLHTKRLENEESARLAITLGRVCTASFWLTKKAWDKFSAFFKKNPKGVLKKSDLLEPDGSYGDPYEKDNGGHAVVLIDANISGLEFLNSWGPQWGNNGRFRIENADVLKAVDERPMRFYDVYWTLNDLTQTEKNNYERSIHATSEAISRNDPDSSKYCALYFKCPHCHQFIHDEKLSTSSTVCICTYCNLEFNPRDSILRRGLFD